VLLAVTAPLMRAAAEACLHEHGFAVRSSAVDAAAVIESAVRELPDIALIDTDLPGGAITAATEVSSAVPGTAVVMLAEAPTEADLMGALYAGAVGCMPKHTSLAGLARALQGVLAGEPAVPRNLVGAMLQEIRGTDASLLLGRPRSVVPDLTLRELEVLRLLARGSSTGDIARALSISPITARRHCAGICRKLKVRDRAAAVQVVERSRTGLYSHIN
jgi:DNA-binding NarL/FixJ family response regulator